MTHCFFDLQNHLYFYKLINSNFFMSNIYTGRIRNVSEWRDYSGSHNGYVAVGFISTEGETKGLLIQVSYRFSSQDVGKIFISDLEKRLKKEPGGCSCKVCLSKPLDMNSFEYDAKGPIRFLEDEPPRSA